MGETAQTATGPLSFVRSFTRYQWMVFLVVWLGWTLDGTDFGLFSLVLRPALTELMGGHATIAQIGRVGGLLAMVSLLGWALGGFFFGVIADYIGRVRALALSIAIVAVFTGLQGFAQNTFEFGILRFLTGVGTGAEIVIGIPLVAEVFADAHRAKVLGVMMTGGGLGTLIGGQIYALVGAYGWRYVMFTGVLPALVLLLIRRGMGEPVHFEAVRARRRALRAARHISEDDKAFLSFVPAQLFGRQLRYWTFVGVLFCVGTLLAIWTSNIWLPTIQGQMLARQGITGAAAAPLIGYGMMLFGVGGIGGYAAFGFIADVFGRRPTVVFYNVGTLVAGLYLYLGLHDWTLYPYVLPVFGFFVFGVFSGHAVYLPELFPTHVRATAVSFCNGSGRVITSFGPLVAGLLAAPFGGDFAKATAFMTGFALLSIVAMALGRETRDEELPR
ncbi:MAG TPA: MFS transporter [Acetobacteraceae bacterium]|jgi:MFS family permease|nr:MFS transporter [Acetobacteraceae bacterium]